MCYTGTESIPWTMTPYLALIILLGCHYAGVEVQGQPAIFYPFGASAGDATLYINDDGSSGRLPISIGFPFYGNTHTSLYVSINPHNDERFSRYIEQHPGLMSGRLLSLDHPN